MKSKLQPYFNLMRMHQPAGLFLLLWPCLISLNIATLTHLTKLFLPAMLTRKSGKILNLASIASFFPGPNMAGYYATKAFVLSFSEALSSELEGTGVSVTCLCPGPTASNFQAAAGMEDSKIIKGKKLPT
jgi:short-subunit dehydrogenase